MTTENLFTYAQWSGIATVACLLLAIISFVVGWNFRFRLVGVTSFMAVLTLGILALGLGLFTHTTVPGAAHYSLVYDNGANQAVVVVAPDIEVAAIKPTLRQASADLYSYGRTGTNGNSNFVVKLRTILHPQPDKSLPLFLGEAKRPLFERSEDKIEIEIYKQNLAKLPKAA
jgi:hypothetical protein